MDALAILGAAVAFDLLLGEYPSRLHPVVWTGRLTDALLDWSPRSGSGRQFAYGVFLVVIVAFCFTLPAWAVLQALESYPAYASVLAGALIVKPTFSIRALWESVAQVAEALVQTDLQEARRLVGQIVSRDTTVLSGPLVAAAALESTAENFTDSVVAPLFYFLLLGPLGALGYRVVNTLDAIVGYRGQYEYLGKAAARLDDLLNIVPARLGGLLLVACAAAGRGSVTRAWGTMWRDHGATESPNAGWTMSALAGALGVRLEKLGAYQLGAEHPEPTDRDLWRGLRLFTAATTLTLLLAALGVLLLHA